MVEAALEESEIPNFFDLPLDDELIEHEMTKYSYDERVNMFKAWCDAEGVYMPKLEWPATFDGGL